MTSDKSVAETLFEEEDEVWSDARDASVAAKLKASDKAADYNPTMTLAQLRAPSTDNEIATFVATLVMVEATTPEGTTTYPVITTKPEEMVFTSSPELVTRIAYTKLLTAAQVQAYRDIVSE